MSRSTSVRRPVHQFLSDDMWALADNRYFSTFCLRAHLVDDFEPLGFGDRALALAVHDPPGHRPVTDEDFDTLDSVAVRFSTLEVSRPWLWRCDVARPGPKPFRIGLAGAYNKELLEEFRNASVLFLVEVQWFEIWTMEHVFAVIPNDQDFWRGREPDVPNWRFPGHPPAAPSRPGPTAPPTQRTFRPSSSLRRKPPEYSRSAAPRSTS